MGKLVTYGLDNFSRGHFSAILPRGWTVYGGRATNNPPVTVPVKRSVALKDWMLPGAQASMAHSKLELWSGVFDLPWGVTLPITPTVYPQDYLLSMRMPEIEETFHGTVAEIAARVLERINAPQDMFARLGKVTGEDGDHDATFKTDSSYYAQLQALIARAKKEMRLRAELEDRRLINYIDIGDRIGEDTGFLLHDGDGANMQLLDAKLDGTLMNMLVGLGSQSTGASRMSTGPQTNSASANRYRLRSATRQYPNVVQDSALLAYTNNDLDALSWPRLRMPIKLLDVGRTLTLARPGNGFILHTGDIYLPGGKQGWRGPVRLTAIGYDEKQNSVGALAEAIYDELS